MIYTKIRSLILPIIFILAIAGCNKEEIISSEEDEAPTFAKEYIGQMKVTKDINGFPHPRTDSVVLQIDGETYDLFITSNPSSTNICDSRGAFRYSIVAKSVVLELEDFTFNLCDSLRIPQGLFPATVTDNSLIFNGFYVLPGTADTVLYDFKLTVAPPR